MNKLLKVWAAFLAHTPIYLGLLASGLAFTTSRYYKLVLPTPFYFFVFFSTLFVYNLDRILSVKIDFRNQPERTRFFSENRRFIIISMVITIPVLLFPVLFYTPVFIAINFFLFILSIFYIIIFSSSKRESNIRYLAILKPLLIGTVWGCVVLILPFSLEPEFELPESIYYLSGFRFLIYVSNAILFDLKDVPGDIESGKLNFTVWAGMRRIYIYMAGFAVVGAYFLWQWYSFIGDPILLVGEVLSLICLVVIITYSALSDFRFKSELSYILLLDGILFFPVLTSLVRLAFQ
ncbi:MAG: hypothetical protein ABUK01_01540 [Leptospirales bacterium]